VEETLTSSISEARQATSSAFLEILRSFLGSVSHGDHPSLPNPFRILSLRKAGYSIFVPLLQRLGIPEKEWPELVSYLRWYISWTSTLVPLPNDAKNITGSSYQYYRSVPGHLWKYSWQDEVVYGPKRPDGQDKVVMIIGKCLGKDEEARLRNFVGPTSKLFYDTLVQAGFAPEHLSNWYVVNLLKTVQPASWSRLLAATIADFVHAIWNEIVYLRPDYIILLGDDVVKNVLGYKYSVNNLRGAWTDCKVEYEDVHTGERCEHTFKFTAIVHPASVVHNTKAMDIFKSDISMLYRLLHDEQVTVLPFSNVKIIHTIPELFASVHESLQAAQLIRDDLCVAIDCEWSGRIPGSPGSFLRSFQWTTDGTKAYILPLADAYGNPKFADSTSRSLIVQCLNKLLSRTKRSPGEPSYKSKTIVGHNIKADLSWLMYYFPELKELFLDALVPSNIIGNHTLADTMLASHAVKEDLGNEGYSLKSLAGKWLGLPRWDSHLQEFINLLKRNRAGEAGSEAEESVSLAEDYGRLPDNVLFGDEKTVSYAGMDVIATWQIWKKLASPNGLLDRDAEFGLRCWYPYYAAMAAMPAAMQIEVNGLYVDREFFDDLVDSVRKKIYSLEYQLRDLLNWPEFNIRSFGQCQELFYTDFVPRKYADRNAGFLYIVPYEESKTATGYSTSRHVLARMLVLFDQLKFSREVNKDYVRQVISLVYDCKCLDHLYRSTLGTVRNETRPYRYSTGIGSSICSDSCLHPFVWMTKETGRYSTSGPNIQNFAKRREEEYRRILGEDYLGEVRSIIVARPGFSIIEADLVGAELYMMAVQSGCRRMIEQCKTFELPDGHPDKFDIHSAVTVMAFDLKVESQKVADAIAEHTGRQCKVGDPLPADKSCLKIAGYEGYRTITKSIIFGLPYGRSDKSIVSMLTEEGHIVDMSYVHNIHRVIEEWYGELFTYMSECEKRVDKPGWLANCFLRYRRFPKYGIIDDQLRDHMYREARNFPIQSGVADLMNHILASLYELLAAKRLLGDVLIIGQIHDAILLEVNDSILQDFIKDLLLLNKRVTFRRCNLDGQRIGDEEYYIPFELHVAKMWGKRYKPSIQKGLENGQ
jgi:uracil-DNA glycosylase family 4